MAIATPRSFPVVVGHDSALYRMWAATWKFVRTKPLGAAGAAIIIGMAFAAIFADFLAPYDAYELNQRLQFHAPTLAHWLGTDELGRDTLTRVLYAGQVSLRIGLVVAIVSLVLGVPLGLMAGYYGGRIDDVVNAVIQVLQNIPGMFLLIILGTIDERAPSGFAGLIIGLSLTLIHLVGIPITNLSVNPARSTGPALFVGGWALEQLWIFWVAPIAGAAGGALLYNFLGGKKTA